MGYELLFWFRRNVLPCGTVLLVTYILFATKALDPHVFKAVMFAAIVTVLWWLMMDGSTYKNYFVMTFSTIGMIGTYAVLITPI